MAYEKVVMRVHSPWYLIYGIGCVQTIIRVLRTLVIAYYSSYEVTNALTMASSLLPIGDEWFTSLLSFQLTLRDFMTHTCETPAHCSGNVYLDSIMKKTASFKNLRYDRQQRSREVVG